MYLTREIVGNFDTPKNLKFATMNNKDITKIFLSGKEEIMEYEGIFAIETDKDITLISNDGFKLPSNSTGLFLATYYNLIDLRGVDSSELAIATNMFAYCEANDIIISGLDLSSLYYAERMFMSVNINNLDFNDFDLRCLLFKREMFKGAKISRLNLGDIDLSEVDDAFYSANIHELRIKNSKEYTTEYLNSILAGCSVTELYVNDVREF